MSTPVNGPLNASIAALNAQPYPWFAPAFSVRLTDQAVYDSIVATYGFGTNIIMGLSPDAASALTGVAIVTDPSFVAQQIRPEIFVHPDALNVLGVPITLAESGGTIVISYASPFGRFDRVVWEWQCEVTFDAQADPAPVGAWSQVVLTYVGTGVDDDLVPTPFPLDVGVALVWVFPQLSRIASYRSNDPAMLGTIMSPSTVDTVGGIMSFTATGFTVKDHSANNVLVNELGKQYTAIVLSDTTSDNRYLRVGQYAGTSSAGSPVGNSFVTGFNPNAAWIFGRNTVIVFCSDQFAAGDSVSFEIEAKPVTNQITALASTISVGSDNNVNDNALEYYWAAFQIPASDPVRTGFTWYRVVGTGANLDVPLGFLPAFATARPFVTGVPFSVWRGPWSTGTDSIDFATVDQPTGGIVAFIANGLTLGADVAPLTQVVYGFALKSAFSGGGPDGPPYNPDPPAGYIPSGGLISQGLGTGQLGPCGCPLEMP